MCKRKDSDCRNPVAAMGLHCRYVLYATPADRLDAAVRTEVFKDTQAEYWTRISNSAQGAQYNSDIMRAL